MSNTIYMDNAATTALKPKVFQKMEPFFGAQFGNPSGTCGYAQQAKRAVEEAREQIAQALGAKPNEIYFTSGGTESDNWAIMGTVEASPGKHIITSKIEHPAVLQACACLEHRGCEVTYLDVDANGLIKPEDVESAIRPSTMLISIMYANNEIGTIEPIAQIGKLARRYDIPFHTDGVQAFGHLPIWVTEQSIDLLSASGHKFYGPKGIGFLYLRDGVSIASLMHGGGQERALRAGTLNVPAIVGMGEAARMCVQDMQQNIKRQTELRNHLMQRILTEIPNAKLNGDAAKRLPNNVNFCFPLVQGETLVILLDQMGVCASSGSACASGVLEPSHVLTAIGVPEDFARGSLRLTLSDTTTKEEVDTVVEKLKIAVQKCMAD